MINIMRKLAVKYLGHKNALLNYDVDLQKKFISRFSEPKDNLERSYNQYLCQMELNGLVYKVVANAVSPLLLIFYIIKNYRMKEPRLNEDIYIKNDSLAIFFTNTLTDDYLPEELIKKYPARINAELTHNPMLTKNDIHFFKRVMRHYPFSFYFLYKIILKIGVYSRQITQFRPSAIIVSAEYSFTSSIMTSYCNGKGIKHINIQHGEKMFLMEDAFFRFDQCYLWSEIYKRLLIRLKAEPSQFVLSIPPVLTEMEEKISSIRKSDNLEYHDCKYYFASETKSELFEIKKTLDMLRNTGRTICLRPHPRFTDKRLFMDTFGEDYPTEDPQATPIEYSLASCRLAISLRSFVLQQAYYGGVKIAIDDISSPQYYTILEKIEYIMISKGDKLSEIIKKGT